MIVTIILDIDGVSHVCRTFENESIQITKLVASIDNLGSQGTVTRQSFRLPLMGGLVDALGDITDPSQSAKVNLNKSIKGRILVDGFQRFEGSFFVINTTSGDSKEVEMIFQGNETDLKATLSNITMAELCEGETVPYSFNELSSYFSNPHQYTKDNGYLFPVIDYGDNFTYDQSATNGVVNELLETNFKPAITLDKLFKLMPINVTVNNMEQIMHQSILLHNSKDRIPTLDTSPLDNTGGFNKSSDQTFSTNSTITFQTAAAYNSSNIGYFDLTNNGYAVPTTGLYTFQIEGTISSTAPANTNNGTVLILELNSSVRGFVARVDYRQTRSATSKEYNNQLSVQCNAGERISLLQQRAFEVVNVTVQSGFKFAVVQSPALNSSSNIDISSNCPKLTAWDIFRTVAIQANAQIVTNSDGTYEITPWVDWIKDGPDVIILDNIIEDSVDVQIKPFSVQGAKSISLSYAENEDFYSKKYKELTSESFGTKSIANTGTEFAKNELKIEVPISTIPSVPVNSSTAVIPKMVDSSFNVILGKPTLLQSNYTDSGLLATNGAFTNFPFSLGSLFSSQKLEVSNIQLIANWRFQNGGYNETDNGFGQSLSYWRNTGYPKNTLYERYWKKYLEETYSEQSREIKMNIKLSINEIDSLKFNEKFYYKNTLLRLVKLEGVSLTSDQPATATFMKRFDIFPNQISAYYPYDIINSIVQCNDSTSNNPLVPADGSGLFFPVPFILSAAAYGFFYDANRNIATQSGQILIT